MKKLFSIFLIGFSIFTFAQDLKKDSIGIAYIFDRSIDLNKTKYDTGLYCSFKDYEFLYGDNKQIMLVTDLGICDNEYFIKGYVYGNEFYVKQKKEDFKFRIPKLDSLEYNYDEISKSLNKLSQIERIKLNNYSKYLSSLLLEREINEIGKYITSFDKNSIGIIEAVPIINYSFRGARFRIINTSKKTIKYISFNFYGKNRVDDKVLFKKGIYNITRKGIGPIETYGVGMWEFEDIWLTDIVEYLTLLSVNIMYMDGTTKTIKMNENLWFDIVKLNYYEKLLEFEKNIKN